VGGRVPRNRMRTYPFGFSCRTETISANKVHSTSTKSNQCKETTLFLTKNPCRAGGHDAISYYRRCEEVATLVERGLRAVCISTGSLPAGFVE
jgi:hypothetical protein